MKVTQSHHTKKHEPPSDIAPLTEPWLNNPNWATNRIFSSSNSMLYQIVLFTLFWNGFSYAMVYFILPDAYRDSGITVALVILIFPAAGLWLFYITFKGLKEWLTFGKTPLEMTPFPGVIGGNVGGRIPFRKRLNNRYDYHVTLTLLREYIIGSGKDKDRHSKLIWQKSGIATLKQVLADGIKSELLFRFEVPDNLAESSATPLSNQQPEQYLWQLTLENKETGIDRSFEIPIYVASSQINNAKNMYESSTVIKESTEIKTNRDETAKIDDFLPFTANTETNRIGFNQQTIIHYPMFRQLFTNLLLIALGTLFFAVGIFAWLEKGSSLISTLIFCLLGGFIALAALHSLGSSLTITLNKSSLETEQKLFGFSIRKKQAYFSAIQEIKSRISYRSRVSDKFITHYKIIAVINNNYKITLADAESETAKHVVLKYFRDKILSHT